MHCVLCHLISLLRYFEFHEINICTLCLYVYAYLPLVVDKFKYYHAGTSIT